jgi:DNA-binding NarL/FixJ family response regulator
LFNWIGLKNNMPMKTINILLVEDEALIRQGVKALLEKEDFVRDIYEAGNATDFHEQINTKTIDVILLDIKLPGVKGQELLMKIPAKPNQPKVIVVTGLEGVELVINLLKLGVSGIVFKLDGYTEIVKAIREVMNSGYYFPEKVSGIIQANAQRWDHVPPVSLTFQENELLRSIAGGLTTKEMSIQLKMTESTTETYRTRLIKKLGVPNTAALMAFAYRNGIL